MPRIAKDKKVENDKIDEKKVVVKKKDSSKPIKKSTSRKSSLAKIIESIELDTSEEKVKKSTTKAKTSSKKEPAKATENKAKKADKSATSSKKEVSKKAKATTTKKKSETKVATTKKRTESKATTEEKATASAKKAETKSTAVKKATASAKKAETKTTTKKSSTEKSTKAAKTVAKEKTPTKKRASKKTSKVDNTVVQIAEYYDLPLKYGNTVVKLLAQTPKTLFVYWEVSDSDIDNFKKQYGEDFFNKTKPYLIVHNLTLNKTTEVEINDFANSWYLNTEDTDCKFDIELVRKFINSSSNNDEDAADYLYIAKSNSITSPNNHILFEKIQEFVVFRDTNSDTTVKKNIKSFKFLKDIYKFYKDMYDEEILNNPSSQFNFQ